MYFWAAISIGFLGSLHCAGMCGPLLVALQPDKGWRPSHIVHHVGRLSAYMIFGAIAGAIGSTFSFMGFQQGFSLIIGALLVLSVIMLPFARFMKDWEGVISTYSLRLSSWVHQSGTKGHQRAYGLGLANGILPCGLVYLAIAGAANTFTPWDGALFMLMFGLGTLPMLLVVRYAGAMLPIKLRNRMKRLIPISVLVIGLLLMVRGMNLGIPYLSPQQVESSAEIAACN
jgi:hypothetical protein